MYKDNRVISLNRDDKENLGELKDRFITDRKILGI